MSDTIFLVLCCCCFELFFPINTCDFSSVHCPSHKHEAQDEITCFRISETWRKHAIPCFRYVYVLRKRENWSLRDSVTFPEQKCQVTFPSYLSQQISAVVRFRHVSANVFPLVCYIYQNTTQDGSLNNNSLTSRRRTTDAATWSASTSHFVKWQM